MAVVQSIPVTLYLRMLSESKNFERYKIIIGIIALNVMETVIIYKHLLTLKCNVILYTGDIHVAC